MNIVVKVLIDEKEYDRLLEIERKFKEISKNAATSNLSQSGAGTACKCSCSNTKKASMPLDEIVTRNAEADDVEKPIPGILPSITNPLDEASKSKGPVKDIQKTRKTKVEIAGSGSEDHQAQPMEDSEGVLGIAKFVHPWYYIGPPHT